VTGGKPIAVLLQSISGVSAINPLVAFYDIHGGKVRCYSFILSRTPHETTMIIIIPCIRIIIYQLCSIFKILSVYILSLIRNMCWIESSTCFKHAYSVSCLQHNKPRVCDIVGACLLSNYTEICILKDLKPVSFVN
jgi:hypothetical protein